MIEQTGIISDADTEKWDFYSSVLNDDERSAYERALTIRGLNGEIALLRLQLRRLSQSDPQNTRLFLRTTGAIERLIRTNRALLREQALLQKEAAMKADDPMLAIFKGLLTQDSADSASPAAKSAGEETLHSSDPSMPAPAHSMLASGPALDKVRTPLADPCSPGIPISAREDGLKAEIRALRRSVSQEVAIQDRPDALHLGGSSPVPDEVNMRLPRRLRRALARSH